MALRAAMKGAALLVLLMVTLNSSFVVASVNNKQANVDEIDSVYLFHTENNALRLIWTLKKPSGAVRGFRVTWNDGVDDKQTHVAEPEATIDYPSNLDCHDKLTVTVMALNDDNIPIGNGSPKRFDLKVSDVVTDVILTPEENRISASWSIKCPSEEIANIVVIWEEVEHSHELSCQFPGTARDTSAPTSCTAVDQFLQSCKDYYVHIEPLDSSSEYIGIAAKMESSTLEKESGSKFVERMKLKEAKSRSVTLLWQGPNPECVGANYALTYTETRLGNGQTTKGQAKVVQWSKWSNQKDDQSITANLHSTDNGEVMGHVENLVPFSQYELCVAAGNAVTNLVCLRAKTMEEKLDKPRHFSLTTRAGPDNTIDLTWKEPSNMNGEFVNYIVRWHRDSKYTASHKTKKHAYTITDVEPCVNYTITVTAVNGAGEGDAAETTGAIQSGDCLNNDCSPDSTKVMEDRKKAVTEAEERVVVEGKKEGDISMEGSATSSWLIPSLGGALVGVVFVLLIVAAVVFLSRPNKGTSQGEQKGNSGSPSQSHANADSQEVLQPLQNGPQSN